MASAGAGPLVHVAEESEEGASLAFSAARLHRRRRVDGLALHREAFPEVKHSSDSHLVPALMAC